MHAVISVKTGFIIQKNTATFIVLKSSFEKIRDYTIRNTITMINNFLYRAFIISSSLCAFR